MSASLSPCRMRRALIALGATLVLLIASVAPLPTLEAEAPLSDRPLGRRSAAIVPIERPLHGIVLTRLGTDDVRVAGAHVGTGATSIQTDAAGRFALPAA